jgi:hypothetical protein
LPLGTLPERLVGAGLPAEALDASRGRDLPARLKVFLESNNASNKNGKILAILPASV